MARGRPLRRLAGACAVVAALIFPATAGAAEDSLRLRPDQARAYAASLLRQGQASAARALAHVLLEADAGDVGALLILIDAELLLENPKAATAAARRAWAAARTEKERFLAAMGRSAALARQGKYLPAQLWLRRASDLAPSPALERITARRYRALAAENPVRLSFSGSLSPSDNVNGGSSEQLAWLNVGGQLLPFAIPEESQELAGWKMTLSTDVDYRLSQGVSHLTRVSAGLAATRLYFPQRVLDDVPELDARSLGSTTAELRLSHQWRQAGYTPVWRAGVSVSRGWQGGADHAETLRGDLGVYLPDAGPGSLDLSITAQGQSRLDNDLYSTVVFGARLAYALPVGENRLTLSLGAREAIGRSETQDYSAVLMGVRYDLGGPVFGGLGLGLGLDWEDRRHDTSPYAGGSAMWIDALTVSAEATLDGLSVMGFAPVVTVSHGRKRSNASIYTSDQTSLSLGVRSQF